MGADVKSLFKQLGDEVKVRGDEMVKEIKGVILFNIGGSCWTLDLSEASGSLEEGKGDTEPDLELKAKDDDFVKLVMGKLTPQQAFFSGKLRISGSMTMALKLQPILSAAKPRAKL